MIIRNLVPATPCLLDQRKGAVQMEPFLYKSLGCLYIVGPESECVILVYWILDPLVYVYIYIYRWRSHKAIWGPNQASQNKMFLVFLGRLIKKGWV